MQKAMISGYMLRGTNTPTVSNNFGYARSKF